MSSFPQKEDVLSYVGHPSATDVGAPAALMGTINEALMAAEAHLGFSLVTGGDVRHDGTAVAPGPGRRILPLTGTWTVNSAQGGLYGLFAPLSSVLDTTAIQGLVGATASSDLLGSIDSPLFCMARRRRSGMPLASSVVLSQTGQSLLALTLPQGHLGNSGGAFIPGEILDVMVVLWGGV